MPPILPISALIGVVLYIYWLHKNCENSRYYLTPPAILATCLLLSGLSWRNAFQQGEITGYTRNSGWFTDSVWHEPNYSGEGDALAVLLLGPIVGLILMLLTMPRPMGTTQGGHYTALLVFAYPILVITVLVQVGNDRPRFYNENELPAIGTHVPATTPNLPMPPPPLSSERGLWDF